MVVHTPVHADLKHRARCIERSDEIGAPATDVYGGRVGDRERRHHRRQFLVGQAIHVVSPGLIRRKVDRHLDLATGVGLIDVAQHP